MPLPPALAARLAKRGILKPNASENEPVEEVIAEDYDERHSAPSLKLRMPPKAPAIGETEKDIQQEESPELGTDELVYEVLQCPNRINTFHTCSEYCQKRWGFKKFKPDPSALPGRDRLLRRFPLPAGWLEVGDPETGRYYYWNSETDEVSWLSPQHPRAVVTISVDKLKELSGATAVTVGGVRESRVESDDDASTDLDDENPDDEQDFEEMEREFKRKMQSERDRGKDHRRRGGRVDDSLDPMDPAAYSDIPRGSWTTGLETNSSAKTGADVTAAGPLFQQRPYPSPGAVLRMNKEKEKK